jgi:hypothetical protein
MRNHHWSRALTLGLVLLLAAVMPVAALAGDGKGTAPT